MAGGRYITGLFEQAKKKAKEFLKGRSPMGPKPKKYKRAEEPKKKTPVETSVNLKKVVGQVKKRNKKVKSMLDEAGNI